jgi:hypothetical protein
MDRFNTRLEQMRAFFRAYSKHILWPLTLIARELEEIIRDASKSIQNGLVLDIGTGYGHLPVEMA